jgi:hypothetical protein
VGGFALDEERVLLPTGAWARTRRRVLRNADRPVLGLTAGAFRPYLFPVHTPAGFAVTQESPADHPHHHSLWIGADHVHLAMPSHEERDEIYAYNCYVNDVFQGRAPGRIVATSLRGENAEGGFRIVQTMEWRGPVEWGAPEGRLLMTESRRLAVREVPGAYVIDVVSELAPASHRIVLGPTRHAYFNFRVAPSMSVEGGGVLCDDRGVHASAAEVDVRARWIAASGPVGGGHRAGVALAPRGNGRAWWWFVSDWGVATASPCRDEGLELRPGDPPVTLEARYAVFDGDAEVTRCSDLFAA